MKALVYRGGRMVVEDVDDPRPGPGEVLVKVRYCGICGSDVHLFARGIFFPGTIAGHEVSGEVAGLGPEVRGWQPGQRVVVQPTKTCGQCDYCLSGRPQLCLQPEGFGMGIQPGAFAQWLVTHQSTLLALPPGLDLAHAALAEPLAVALHAVDLSGIEPGQAVLVSGAGPIGLLVIEVLKDRQVKPILVSEPSPPRRAIAAKLGADEVVDVSAVSLPDLVRSLTGRGVHAAFECSGAPAAAEAALGLLRPGGTLLVVGTSERSFSLSPLMLMARELRVQGVYGASDRFQAAIDMLAAAKVHSSDIITRIAPLAEAEACLRQLDSERGQGKVLIDPWAG